MSAEPVILDAPAPPTGRRWRRALLVTVAAVLLAGGAGGGGVALVLRASLPRLDGRAKLPGLAAPVIVSRDASGVPTISGSHREDVARATGYVHAQDRFFQMDLMRRRAAGELSEIVGPAALPLDRAVRVHRFRAVAEAALALEMPAGRRLVEAYAAGVNAALAAMAADPPEYQLLRADPAPWRPEDTLLCALSMFLELHDEHGARESDMGVMRELLPAPLVDFLAPPGTEWDAPLVGEPFAPVVVPEAHVLDLRRAGSKAAPARPAARLDLDGVAVGSNNWVVAGAHTADGRPLVADDMHLGMAVPNTWYRAVLTWPEDGGPRRLAGVTLPGTPALVAGSTGRIAWGFTNTEGDWVDLVPLQVSPDDPEQYRTPEGWKRLGHHPERIRVQGGEDEVLDVVTTIWGPVVDRDHRGRPRALRWIAHEPAAVNMSLLRMESARTVADAIGIAHDSGGPPQNLVVADTDGHIGWTVIGRIPRRVGFDGQVPVSWADGRRRWDGWLSPEEVPQVVDPPSGRLWTANGRTVDGVWLERMGHGSYEFGARPRQIRDALLELERATPRDLLSVQLDDRALFLQRWQQLLLGVLSDGAVADHPRRGEMRGLVEGWGVRAAPESAGYRLVRAFRRAVADRALPPLVAPALAADERFAWPRRFPQYEGALWALVTQRPPHLLSSEFTTWNELMLAAADDVLAASPEGPLADRTWGEHNTLAGRHPLSRAIPSLSGLLDLPAQPLPGDVHMPRVQTPSDGASERFVVSPGHEEDGIFHMPGGQSGHFLSPYYRAGHDAWARGEPTPFLPGPPAHTLVLE